MDKKEIYDVVGQALEDIVLPKFSDVDKRFDNVDKKFDKMQKEMNNRFDNVNVRLDIMQKDIDWIKEEIKNIYERLDEFPTRVEFEQIKKRVKFLELKLGTK